MSRVAYVNGRYLPHGEAAVHIEDRGYQFADGVYEVIAVHMGHLVDEAGHLDRLEHSLTELRLSPPMTRRALKVVIREMIRRNRISDGIVYLQITRGVAPRDHSFPGHNDSSLVMTARRSKPPSGTVDNQGVDVITIPDIRWKRCDIKSISLLPNVLGKQQAHESGAYEAWMVDDQGWISEGTSTNAWIVTSRDELVTRHADHAILNGITRKAVMKLARDEGMKFVERPFTVEEAVGAREAFVTSTTSLVKPVVRIDGRVVGDGSVGPLCGRLFAIYAAHMERRGGDD